MLAPVTTGKNLAEPLGMLLGIPVVSAIYDLLKEAQSCAHLEEKEVIYNMYKRFYNQLNSERSRWKAYSGKKICLPLSNPQKSLRTRHLIRHYVACLAIVDMLDAKDPYTAEHSMRVSKICLRLALIMNLSRTQIISATIAAGAHDIGKVGVPDCVLLKEGPLDSREFDIIKHHPGIGANILLKIHGFEKIASGVWHHHERWDGTGYPNGQAALDIPLYARMIAICDSIDAMRSNRSYRKGMSDCDCRREMEKNAGIMYDPDLVSLCLSNWDFLIGDLYINL